MLAERAMPSSLRPWASYKYRTKDSEVKGLY